MAKKASKPAQAGGGDGVGIGTEPQAQAGNEGAKTQDALVDFAEDLGAFLGTVQTKASSWLEQRKMLADRLTQIRDTANEYLQQLTGQSARAGEPSGARRGRPPGGGAAKQAAGSVAPPDVVGQGRGGKRTMSPEARERIAAAQRKRWAKVRKEQGR